MSESTVSIKLAQFEEVAPSGFNPSPQQEAIFDWVLQGRGNALVEAVAGSGKSTTLFHAMQRMSGFVDYVVYNKKNDREAYARMAQMKEEGKIGKTFMSGTFHKFGWGAWRKTAPGCKIEGFGNPRDQGVDNSAGYLKWDRMMAIMDGLEDDTFSLPRADSVPYNLRGFVKKIVGLAKQRALGVNNQVVEYNQWVDIINHHALDEDLMSNNGPDTGMELANEGIRLAQVALTLSIKLAREVIDFEDMVYMPLFNYCRVWQNDWVLVDEAQDANQSRRLLARKMMKPNGRMIWVGDRHQAVYGFVGADNDSMDIIKRDFHCQEFPLSVSYRNPKAVVAMAQQWVPQITAHESAPEGSIRTINMDEFHEIREFTHEDAVVCRNNAPLVTLAFNMIRRGIPCYVEGRDIGKEIMNLASRWQIANLFTLSEKVVVFKKKEVAKLLKQKRDGVAGTMADRCDTLIALIDGMPKGATVADLHTRIESMFQDTTHFAHRKCIVLSSIHKAKGLEWDRVYLLGRNALMPSKYAKSEWELDQEQNLAYIAVTRTKRELVEISIAVRKNSTLMAVDPESMSTEGL